MLNLTRGFDAPFDALLEHFTPDGADLLTASLNEMRANDTPFAVELPDASRTRGFRITGFRNKTADKKTIDVLWVREITETTKQLTELRDKKKSLESRNALLEQIFDALPVPLWARNDGYQIVLCNSAYAVIARAENPEKAVLLGSELVYEKSANEAKIIASTARAVRWTGGTRMQRACAVGRGRRMPVARGRDRRPRARRVYSLAMASSTCET